MLSKGLGLIYGKGYWHPPKKKKYIYIYILPGWSNVWSTVAQYLGRHCCIEKKLNIVKLVSSA